MKTFEYLDGPSPLTAIELATLAALVAPGDTPDMALRKAMPFYVEAELLRQDFPKSLLEMVLRFGTEKQRQEALTRARMGWEEAVKAVKALVLELGPQESDDDEARRFFREQGLPMKTVRAVLDNIRKYWRGLPSDTFGADAKPDADEFIEQHKRTKNGKTVYHLPPPLLESIVAWKRSRRSAIKRKAWKKRRVPKPTTYSDRH